jgi:hypothetical protein
MRAICRLWIHSSDEGTEAMKKRMLIRVGMAVSLAVLAIGAAIAAQDKYTLYVPNGLAFAEFKGYEDWPVIALSQNGGLIAVILGNPVMIDAYRGFFGMRVIFPWRSYIQQSSDFWTSGAMTGFYMHSVYTPRRW